MKIAITLLSLFLASLAVAQQPEPTTGITLSRLGTVAARDASSITSSPWSIGGETLDRDFAVYAHYKQFLGPLGAKGIRLQAGWAKCERIKGRYDFGWLDDVVNNATRQGVRPWLELSYGNTLYPGGGETGLGGGFPSSSEALAAWDRWTRALVERYRDRVTQWEVWNEPDLNKTNTATAEAYVSLFSRTARMIRTVQPEGKIWALALAHSTEYADKFLAGMKANGDLALIDAITFHGYPRNPDDTGIVDQLRAICAKHGCTIELRQGETGAPSKYQENFALSKIAFTETSHAKWDLRRLLAHRAKDVPMNLFTLSDLHYTTASAQGGADGVLRMNYKGLLATNPDQTIAYAKPAYFAAQTVFAIFDDSLRRIPDLAFSITADRRLALTGYKRATDGAQVVAYWYNDAAPVDTNLVAFVDLKLPDGIFTDPVIVDVRTSTVYALPKETWKRGAKGLEFRSLPIYDSPMLLIESSVLKIRGGD